MRKVVLLMHVSLDGFVCGLNGEMDWIKLDNELWDYVTTITDASDTALYGTKTYKMMESYWPTAAQKPNATKHDIDHSRWVNNADKIVFSKTLEKTNWENTRIVRDNVAQEIANIKSKPGKNLLMLGSPKLAQSFMNLGLIDELILNVNPIILGEGLALFDGIQKSIDLDLISAKAFGMGVVGLHYAKKG